MSDVLENTRFLKSARELRVYKAAFDISLEIHRATLEFPKIEQYALADQMRRASKSICANLADGFPKQRHSIAEFNRYLAIASGSASEMGTWVDYALALGYVPQEYADKWLEQYDHILRMLYRLRQSP